MPMQRFRIGEAALNCFLAALVQAFARLGEPVCVDRLLVVFPYMPDDDLDPVRTPRALPLHRTTGALVRRGSVFPVALAVGGAVREDLTVGAKIGISFPVVNILAFVEIAVSVVRTAVAHDAVDPALIKPLADGRGEVAGIQPDRAHVEVKALPHAVEPSEIGHAVMHVGRGDVNVGDERMGAIDGAVIKVEESGGLAVAHHITRFGIGAAELDLLDRGRVV